MEVTQWKIVGASVAGTSHLKLGQKCDDAHDYWQDDDGSLLLVVADGAGSARYAEKGARAAVKSVIEANKDILQARNELVSEEQWKGALEQILVRVRAHLELLPILLPKVLKRNEAAEDRVEESSDEQSEKEEQKSEQEVLSLHDFATTLLLAFVTPQGGAAAQIGDGAIVIHQENGELALLMKPEHGEYLNQTTFITDRDYLEQVQYALIPEVSGIKGIALMTDGLENLALDFVSKKAHAPFFVPLFRFAGSSEATQEELSEFLSSERVCKQTDDDKTLLMAVRE
jgi:serine/threonine protein phosphatase PrpC